MKSIYCVSSTRRNIMRCYENIHDAKNFVAQQTIIEKQRCKLYQMVECERTRLCKNLPFTYGTRQSRAAFIKCELKSYEEKLDRATLDISTTILNIQFFITPITLYEENDGSMA